jgi:hypothetical protein
MLPFREEGCHLTSHNVARELRGGNTPDLSIPGLFDCFVAKPAFQGYGCAVSVETGD